jgi:hypothetical protein
VEKFMVTFSAGSPARKGGAAHSYGRTLHEAGPHHFSFSMEESNV